MRRPRIKRTTEPVTTPDGDIYLMRPSAGNDIKIEKPNEEQRQLLEALNGEHTLEQLREKFDEKEVDDTITQFLELGVIEDATDDDLVPAAELARFDRQHRYFSDIGDGEVTPSECQRRLREAKVAVLGVGGLGGAAARSLASVGVGEMWLIDGDRVEPSNLNRQTLYTVSDFELLKVEAATARLRSFNPEMRVTSTARRLESEAEIAEFIAGSDVVIDAADWPAHDIERWCNSACFKAGIPYITMSHFPPIARVGPLYVPGVTGCFSCQEIGYRREYPLFDVAVEQRRAKASPAATLGPACGMIGGQVALEVMHLLTGLARPSTQGVAHISDLRTLKVKRESVKPEPECPICSHLEHEEAPGEED
jgi:bacteriocin biosynthesis cyclodehydratase domain-containing protein